MEQPTVSQPTTSGQPSESVQSSTAGSVTGTETASDAQADNAGVKTADSMRAIPFVLAMFAALTMLVVLAGRKKKEVK